VVQAYYSTSSVPGLVLPGESTWYLVERYIYIIIQYTILYNHCINKFISIAENAVSAAGTSYGQKMKIQFQNAIRISYPLITKGVDIIIIKMIIIMDVNINHLKESHTLQRAVRALEHCNN